MPSTTLLESPPAEHIQLRTILRRTRSGSLLACHALLLGAAGRTPTEIAAFLLGSRSSVYRLVRAYRPGRLEIRIDPAAGQLSGAMQATVLMPWLTRSLGALLTATPRAYGWWRTRWSCATLAATLQSKHGIEVSAGTGRRGLHEIGWVWKRAQWVAKDDDPHRIERLARIRFQSETLQGHEIMAFADALDSHLLPKVGAAWMPQGTRGEGRTPGTNEKHSLAGALPPATGTLPYCLGPRKNNGLFRDPWHLLDTTSPAPGGTHIDAVADNSCMHQATAVAQWFATPPRFTLLWLPTYCPRAHPIARVFGDVHDKCTRNHKRKRLRDVVQAVERHVQANGPWQYNLSRLYQAPEGTAMVEPMAVQDQDHIAA